MRPRIVLLVLTLVFAAAAARAATVYLKDGSTLKGTIVSATARDVQLHTPDGTLKISVDRIARIDYSEAGAPPAQAAPAPAPEPAPAFPRRYPRRFRRWLPEPDGVPFEDRRREFSFDLGLNVPYGDVSFSAIGGGTSGGGSTGFLGGLQYTYLVSPRVGLGLAFDYAGRASEFSGALLPNGDTRSLGGSQMFLAQAKLTLSDHGRVRPYLMPGLGVAYTSLTVDGAPKFGFAWGDTGTTETRRLIDDQHWSLAGAVKLGLDFDFNAPYFACLEVGWFGVPRRSYGATPDGQALGLGSVSTGFSGPTISGRWGWRF